MAHDVGSRIGPYEVLGPLGAGGMGVVYRARDTRLGREVAVKVLLEARGDARSRSRFLREAQLASSLSHPNVLALHDVGEQDGLPYLVTELLTGRTLREVIAGGPLQWAEALALALQSALGLAAAHEKGIVHRDLKPENLFLTADGLVKILDFGIARQEEPARSGVAAAPPITATGAVLGTPAYMSPEQLCGEPADARSDLFSFGCVLYELLCGQRPFAAASGVDVAFAILHHEPMPLPVSTPPAVAALVARCLEKAPERRIQTARELVAALRGLPGVEAAAHPSGERTATVEADASLPRTPGLDAPTPGLAGAGAAPPPRSGLRAALASRGLAALLALAAAGAAFWLARGGLSRREPKASAATVAVLPFADLSPQRDQEYFSDGIAEEILDALARVPGLRVAGRTSSFSFKGSAEDVRSLGRKLGVGTVLEGSVRRAGSRARISAKMVNVADGFTVWSQTYDRELTDVFTVQEDIARAVVAALEVHLAARDAPAIGSHRTARPEVYDTFLLARGLQRRADPESWRGAAAAFEKVLALEPGYAPAWAGLAEAAFWVSEDAGDVKQLQEEHRARAFSAAERAVALDPSLAAGFNVRAFLRVLLRWDFEGGRQDFERALALGVSDPAVLRDYGSIALIPLGRTEEGLAAMDRAALLDPLDAMVWWYLAISLPATGDLERAARAAERALALSPGHPFAAGWRAIISMLAGRPAEALELAKRHLSEPGPEMEGFRLMVEALARHSLGDEQASRKALEQFEARFALTGAYQIGAIHAWRGEADEAFSWLERAIAQHDTGAVQLTRDPLLRSLRGDPRYAALLRKINLPLK